MNVMYWLGAANRRRCFLPIETLYTRLRVANNTCALLNPFRYKSAFLVGIVA